MRSLTPAAAALVLCALVLPVSIAGTNVALALLSLALLVRARSDGKRIFSVWRSEPALAALLLYAATGLAAAALSSSPAASLRDAAKDLHRLWSLGLFAAALALEPEAPLRPALGASFGVIALYGIAQSALGSREDGLMVRAHGFVHPVVFGGQIAIAVLGGACVLLRPTLKASRATAALFTTLVFAVLILNQTRMALLAALAGFAVVALLEPRARRWALPALLAGVAVCLAWEFIPNGGRTISSLMAPYNPGNPHQARWALWNAALKMFRDHPLFGVGPGGYHRFFTTYHAGALDGESGWGSAHNLYLNQLAERGALGALALLVLCATLFARAVRAARSDADTRALWAAGSVATFLTLSLTETSFQNEQFSTLIMLVWAWGTISLRPDWKNL
jgi:O-antigen ligase